jgi:HD-like signal output (HDOD) protein/signal transduction histidine kinase
LLDICHDPDSSLGELADMISIDPALTSKLIMAANSGAFAINQPLKNLEQAVTLIGHQQVKTMVATSAIQQLFAGLIESQKKYICSAWLDSIYCAVFARDIAIALDYEYPQDAYLAGLLHDVGQVVFDAKYHDQYIKIINSSSDAETIAQEISKFGISHTELGAGIIERWPSLSPSIADAVRFHHEDEELLQGGDVLCRIVAEASQIARHWCETGVPDSKWRSSLIGQKDLKGIYIHAHDKVTLTANKLGISLPRTKSLTQDRLSKDIEKETVKLARKIRDASLIKVISAEETYPVILNSPAKLLSKVSRDMQLYFSISHLALLYQDPENPGFLSLHEVQPTDPLCKFAIEKSNSQAVQSFVEKRQLWIHAEGPDHQKSPVPDRQIIHRLQHHVALCFPLVFENQAIGSIVVGCHKTQRNNLEKLAEIISSYLEDIAETWIRHMPGQGRRNAKSDREQKEIDKLIHEISNPLGVIGNYIDIVNARSGGTGSDKEIGILKEELQRVRNIVLNFKDGAKVETEAVMLNAELESSVPLYAKSASPEREIQVMWDLDANDAEIDITRDAFRQIVLNLVKNAVEAQTDDAAIMVSSQSFSNIDGRAYAQFTISDRGRGINTKTRGLLFSPLVSVKEGAGRGLGLSVVADILRAFKGQVKYVRNEVGGALFEVSIPLSPKQ